MQMSQDQMAAAFNEWMRRFIEDPAAFEAEFQMVSAFLAQKAAGREPSYGAQCAALLQSLAPPAVIEVDHSFIPSHVSQQAIERYLVLPTSRVPVDLPDGTEEIPADARTLEAVTRDGSGRRRILGSRPRLCPSCGRHNGVWLLVEATRPPVQAASGQPLVGADTPAPTQRKGASTHGEAA